MAKFALSGLGANVQEGESGKRRERPEREQDARHLLLEGST